MQWFHEIYSPDEDDGVGRAIYRSLAEGKSPGRKALREKLDLDQPQLEGHLKKLKKAGLIEIGRGQGGSIRRLPRKSHGERELYEPMAHVIGHSWAGVPPHNYLRGEKKFLEVLPTQGINMGAWGAPDVTLLGGKTLPYLPGKFLDIVTFEIKPAFDLRGLYEALAHRRRANLVYLLVFHPAGQEVPSNVLAQITREANNHGIGFILASQEDDFELWDELVEPVRFTPDPESLHDFVEAILRHREDEKHRLRDWLEAESFSLRLQRGRPEVDLLSVPGLQDEDLKLAEQMYSMIPLDRGIGAAALYDRYTRDRVLRVRRTLAEAGIIRTTRGKGAVMTLPVTPPSTTSG